TSLGADVQSVKAYANDFIDIVFNENLNSRIAIVGFSQNVSIFPLSNNTTAAKNFVNSLQSQDATKLYEAIDAGIDILDASIFDGKALIVFTDGRNNAWSTSEFETSQHIRNKLITPTQNGVLISVFTIGLE